MAYVYIRMSLVDRNRFNAAREMGKTFKLTDFGVIVAAGKGEPPPDLLRDLALAFPELKHPEPYLGPLSRGVMALEEGRYGDALPDLKTASESKEAVSADYSMLGACYGRLGRWDEALTAHKRAFELEAKEPTGTDAALHLLEAFILSGRPGEVEPFVAGLVQKKWQPREGTPDRLNQASAMFYGFQAVAQRVLGNDATELEKKMRQYTALTRMKRLIWSWVYIDDWLKTTKLAPDRKAAVEKIIGELKGVRSETE
jgi:tetratricopeptide (TPR) repeat protein